MTPTTTPPIQSQAIEDRVERALMFIPYDRVRRRFHLSRSEMEDIAGPEEAEPERNQLSGY